ncbi:hypothetical protein LTR91_010603 [Friedmanniomyces endolithicus]|uniref:DUF1640 domain-containing protein n=1 Tax=Friedmanniomyces endolithicus TaxID=329885 RepID=A0A4U0USM5_9PEZI|nr:hypothetical protein LTS09_015206 [Friedmanniomyces endolithicus]KAK0306053.1 hypothetical protein LTR01_006401 [Friedmanniomyces endolithicus]KAK0828234.1 hypothetical protein LTR73_005187 [Friedmanniomyces endolithicus]KAK0919906.1 hypothetical protein LTR57_010344 [Friedmanniomyces endolithicus]KAK0926921.1 hypothetical protein LTR29_017777 [Friedmanniomyces endolithicus]
MAGPRLPFLWPILFRSAEVQTPAIRSARAAARFRAYHATPRRKQQETVPQRYGSANEPPPHLGGGKSLGPFTQQPQVEQTKLPKIGERLQRSGEDEVEEERAEATRAPKHHDNSADPTTVDSGIAAPVRGDPTSDTPLATEDLLSQPSPSESGSVESLLDSIPGPAMPTDYTEQQTRPEQNPDDPPLDHTRDEHSPPIKAPHLDQPRYVHHFDTYGLVKQLTSSGWSTPHATLVMKAVRLMLADNMELAKDALVSKSMVENETYLFRAACAELKTEVSGRRRTEHEKMQTERTHLQHEVDILSQRVGQESGVLKDDLKGMFDDRKMGVRNEQRGMESKIQQLNYKITVSLQADARSEVEGLRWVMTRRVIITLAAIVLMVIGGLRLAANALHERELEAKKRANQRSGGTQTEERRGTSDYGGGNGTGVGGGGRDGRGMGGGEVMIKGSEDAAFVSLG